MIVTIAFPSHADLGANLRQHVMVSVGRVLEPLIAMNDQSRLNKSLTERYNHLSATTILCDIGYPFLIGNLGLKLPL
ncbi:hypothetical protein [Paenibacillus sp. B1-35]